MPALLAVLALLTALCSASTAGQRYSQGHIAMDDGVRIWHRSLGEGPEAVVVPVLVLTSPHFDALAKGRRVIYYDPRGRGRSDTGALKHLSVARNLRDLEGLRQALGLERMALIGYSGFGLEFAMYALEHPARVTRLVQLAPVPPRLSPWMDARGPAMQARIDRRALAEYERLRDSPPSDAQERCRLYQRAYAPAVSAHPERVDPAVQCTHPTEWPENQQAYWAAFMPSLAALDVRPRLGALRVPRLVVWPGRDAIPLDGVKEWLVPGAPARLLTVRDADHAVYLDRPDVVMPAIDRFLRGEWPEGVE